MADWFDFTESKAMKVEGLEELFKGFDRLDYWVEADLTKKGLKDGTQVIADEAKELAPRKTGELERNIKVRAGRSREGYYSFLASVGKGWGVGKTFYGAFQEFGWKSGKRPGRAASRSGKDSRKQNAGEHYMQYALEGKQDEALAVFVASAKKSLEAELNK